MHAEELHEDGRDEATDDGDLKSVDLDDQAFWYCLAIQNCDTCRNKKWKLFHVLNNADSKELYLSLM